MGAASDVGLEVASEDASELLANLLQLYLHDMSEIFPIAVGADGRFGYENLPRFWSEPETHFAFLIRSAARVAGFALVTRGSPASDDPAALDVAEFFVLRSHRRSGIGARAAGLLWDRRPGHWIVRVSHANRAGVPFWEKTVRDYTHGTFSAYERPGMHHPFRVFSFTSGAPTAAA